MTHLNAAVGDPRQGSPNHLQDVLAVQNFLNNWILHGALKGRHAVLKSGKCDPSMIQAIGTFQKFVLGFSKPDHKIDPGGRTWRALTGRVTTGPLPRTDYTAPDVIEKRGIASLDRGDKYVRSSRQFFVDYDPNFDTFAATVAHAVRHLIVYRTDNGKFARGLVRGVEDLQVIHDAYSSIEPPPKRIRLIAHLFRRRDAVAAGRWVMLIRFNAPDHETWSFSHGPTINLDVRAKIMDSILGCAFFAASNIGGPEPRKRVLDMVLLADRLGYPRNEQLWYYNPNPMRRFFSKHTSNEERARMTSATGSELPFDGYAHPESWRAYPFRTMAKRFGHQEAASCSREIEGFLKQVDEAIFGSLADIDAEIGQTGLGGGGMYYGAPKLFHEHLEELRRSPDHLYSAFPSGR